MQYADILAYESKINDLNLMLFERYSYINKVATKKILENPTSTQMIERNVTAHLFSLFNWHVISASWFKDYFKINGQLEFKMPSQKQISGIAAQICQSAKQSLN